MLYLIGSIEKQNENDAFSGLFNTIVSIFENSQSLKFEDVLEIIVDVALDLFQDEIDTNSLKSHLHHLCEPIILLRNSRAPTIPDEMKIAVDDLLSNHKIDQIDNGNVLKNCFHELSNYDKLVEINGTIKPVLLNMLFDFIILYSEMLDEHRSYEKELDSINRTIALSTSHSPQRMLYPLNPYLKSNLHNGDVKPQIYSNIIESFKDNPYATDFALSAVRLLGTDSFINIEQEKITAFDFASQFANSSKAVHKKDIINSFSIQLSMFYLKDHFFQKLLNMEKHIPHEQLAFCIDLILGYFFNINTLKKKTDPRKFKKKVQVRTHFDTIPLYEYIRKGKEKEHPALQDYVLMHEIQEKIKGKISEISSVPKLSE